MIWPRHPGPPRFTAQALLPPSARCSRAVPTAGMAKPEEQEVNSRGMAILARSPTAGLPLTPLGGDAGREHKF